MAKRRFVNAENPQGAPPPEHKSQALNALASLAKRGGHNVQSEHLPQRPMPQAPRQPAMPAQGLPQPPKPQSPVVQELLNRVATGQHTPNVEPPPPPEYNPQQAMEASLEEALMTMSPEEAAEAAPPGAYTDMFERMVMETNPPEGDWKWEALDRFRSMREKIARMRDLVEQIERTSANA